MSWLDVSLITGAVALLAIVFWGHTASRRVAIVMVVVAVGIAAPTVVRVARDSLRSDARSPSGLAILGDSDEIPDVGPLPESSGISDTVRRRVAQSIVKVTGRACGQRVNGTGWIVANGLVATNAHVVAGMVAPAVIDSRDANHDAVIVAFDPVLDVALLRTPQIGAPLELHDGPQAGIFGIFGHPHGRPLRVAPARLELTGSIDGAGPDIYGTGSYQRPVMVLATKLAPGDSGSPVVDREGAVVGMTFAIDPDGAAIGYALDASALTRTLAVATDRPVAVPACL